MRLWLRKEYSRKGASEWTHFSRSYTWSKGQWNGSGCWLALTPGIRQLAIGFQKRSHQHCMRGMITLRRSALPSAIALCTRRRWKASSSRWRLGLRIGNLKTSGTVFSRALPTYVYTPSSFTVADASLRVSESRSGGIKSPVSCRKPS